MRTLDGAEREELWSPFDSCVSSFCAGPCSMAKPSVFSGLSAMGVFLEQAEPEDMLLSWERVLSMVRALSWELDDNLRSAAPRERDVTAEAEEATEERAAGGHGWGVTGGACGAAGWKA